MPVLWLECDIRMLHLGIWRLVLGPMAHEKVSYWCWKSINTTDDMFHGPFVGLRISDSSLWRIFDDRMEHSKFSQLTCRRCKQISKLLCKLLLFKDQTIHTLASWASRFDYQPIRAGRSPPSSPESGFFCSKVLNSSPLEHKPCCYVIHFQVFNSPKTCHLIHCLHTWLRWQDEERVVELSHSSPHKSHSNFCFSTFSIDTSCWPAGLDRSR